MLLYILPGLMNVLASTSLAAAQTPMSCSKHVATVMQTALEDGLTITCCDLYSSDCRLELATECQTAPNTTNVHCLSAGGARSCIVSAGLDQDLPCGAYGGPRGAGFGISPVSTAYAVPLINLDVQAAVQRNWARLSALDNTGLCCSAADVAQAAGCHFTKITQPCNSGEYRLRCAGTRTLGLCTLYSNEAVGAEIGQYYFVNFEATATNLPHSLSETVPETKSNTRSSVFSATQSPPLARSHSAVNPVVIAVPLAAAALVVIGMSILFFRFRYLVGIRATTSPLPPPPVSSLAASAIFSPSETPASFAGPPSTTLNAIPNIGKLDRVKGNDQSTQLPPYSLIPIA